MHSIEFEEMAYEFHRLINDELVGEATIAKAKFVKVASDMLFKKFGADIDINFTLDETKHKISITGEEDSDNMFLLAFTYWQEFRLLEKKFNIPHKRLGI